jgi:hypothetical protein
LGVLLGVYSLVAWPLKPKVKEPTL